MVPVPNKRIWVEAWSPEYGASYEVADGLARTEEDVAPTVEVETTEWAPIAPAKRDLPPVAFLDGVSRVDARAFMDAGAAVIPGLCGSVGAGAVLVEDKAIFGPSKVRRSVVFGSGAEATLPSVDPSLVYESRSVPGSRPEELNLGLQEVRSSAEDELAARLAREGWLVIADGPARVREPLPVIGMIKSHHKAYLGPELEPVVRALVSGERTPVFLFGIIRPRYSWYLRLADDGGEHPWAGVVRCEVTAALSMGRAFELADLAALHLPRFASRPFWDSRAPQNLVPIATLERRLWHLLGDREIVYRRIRSALTREVS
jgi:hypothetical protein